jgi:hypothetical protein
VDGLEGIRGPNAEEAKRTPGLTLRATHPTFTEWLVFAQQWDPKGFDAVEVATDAVYAPEAEAVINGLQAIGIRAELRPLERAGFYKEDQEKAFKHLVRVGSAAAGNAATRIEAFAITGGIRS